jgi:hypothetical protein
VQAYFRPLGVASVWRSDIWRQSAHEGGKNVSSTNWPSLTPRNISGTHFCLVQCLRHCATNRKAEGSVSNGVIGIFHWHNPSGRTVALWSTQPLIDMSTGNVSCGKGCLCVRLATLPSSCSDCLKIWEPQTPGFLRAPLRHVMGLLYLHLTHFS